MIKRKISYIFMLILLVGLISATGLEIIGEKNHFINKTEGVDQTITLSIKNTENFKFYNVSFEDNYFIYTPKFDLEPNEQKNITATISGNTDFNGEIKLEGVYESNIGSSSDTYHINIDYTDGIDICSLSPIYIGDTVVFNNLVNDYIILKNVENDNVIQQIEKNNSYSTTFETPNELRYVALRQGFVFTDICSIDILDTIGAVHNPNYDTSINLDVDIFYEQTLLQANFLTFDYSINWNSYAEDIFSIKNIGDKKAKNIEITGDWFSSLSSNYFDLDAGESRTISFKINPIITNSSQTGITHHKNITIKGNFETISKNFNIFIPYSEIVNNDPFNSSINHELIRAWLKNHCELNPNDILCKPIVVYKEDGTKTFNVTMTEEQVKGIWSSMFEFFDGFETYKNIQKEQEDAINSKLDLIQQDYGNLSESVKRIDENAETRNAISLISIIFFIFVGVSAFLLFFIFKQREKNVQIEKGGFKSYEKTG